LGSRTLFVQHALDRERDDPQRIFESLNSTGLELSQADLIRNYILMGLKREKQLQIYRDYWSPIEEQANSERGNINKVSDFIRDFLTLEFKKIPNKDKVYEEFKKQYPIHNFRNIEDTLPSMKKLSFYYNRLLNPDNEDDREIKEQLNLINRLEINVSFPLLLQVYNDYKEQVIDKNDFIDILEMIQSFVWRRFIVGLPTNALNKIFIRLYEDIDKKNYLSSFQESLLKKKGSQRFPNNSETITVLKEKDVYNIKTKNRIYFLERLENYKNNEKVQIINNPDITIEHIFPQNPVSKWKKDLGEVQFNKIKEKYLNTIANLTLSGNNGKLANKSFKEKRDMNQEGKEQGYRFSRLWLNKYLSSLEKWDIEEIEKRFSLIIGERFKQIWKYPDIELKKDDKYDLINIFEADNPRHKKLSHAIFLNEKLNVKTVTDLYSHVIKTLFDLEPKTFFTTDLEEKIFLTKDKSQLRQPLQIHETYYVEANLDSNNKFNRIKHALSIFNLEDELFIKFDEKS